VFIFELGDTDEDPYVIPIQNSPIDMKRYSEDTTEFCPLYSLLFDVLNRLDIEFTNSKMAIMIVKLLRIPDDILLYSHIISDEDESHTRNYIN